MTDTNVETAMLHHRVQQMELLLGLYDTVDATEKESTMTNIDERISTLEQQCTKCSVALQDDWNVIDQLLQELSPGTALTHQRQVVAPIIYRKQEILASASTYQKNIHEVQQILNLLSIGQTTTSSKRSNKITEQEVIKATIITETTGMMPEQETTLDALSTTLIDLQRRVRDISYRLDTMMDHYANLISAISEKMILIGEKLEAHDH